MRNVTHKPEQISGLETWAFRAGDRVGRADCHWRRAAPALVRAHTRRSGAPPGNEERMSPIPKTAPFAEEEIDLLNRVVGTASPVQRLACRSWRP